MEQLVSSPRSPNEIFQSIRQKDDSFIIEEPNNDEFPNYSYQQRNQPRSSKNKLQTTFVHLKQISFKLSKKPKFLKFILKQQAILRFIQNLIQNAYIYRKNVDYIKEKYISQIEKNSNELNIQQQHNTIKPDSFFLIAWDLIGICIILLSLWLCPFLVCFLQDNDQNYTSIKVFESLIIIYQFFDILISINRAIIRKGEIIQRRLIIIQIYFKETFLFDILNQIMWILFFFDYKLNSFITIGQLFIIVLYLKRKINVQFEYFYLRGELNQILDLINVIVSVYFVAHTMACFWYYLGNETYKNNQISWLVVKNIIDESLYIKYCYSLYWATMTMVTVGYGDITAQNYDEMVGSIAMMFISSCMFAYSMNSIGYILKVFYDNKLKYKKSLLLLNSHMNRNNIENQLQSRVRNFMQYHFEKEKNGTQEDIDLLFNTLPNNLKNELNTDIQMRIIKQIKILKYFTSNTQKLLSQQFEYQTYITGDIISSKNVNDQFLYFLFEGNVSISEQQSNTELTIIQNQNIFGEYSFFTGISINQIVKANSICRIYRIQRSKTLEIIRYNQKDFEIFHQIKDELIFQNNYQSLDLQCKFCQKFTHLNINCPVNQYKPDIEKQIKQNNFNSFQQRMKQFTRKKQQSLNALSILIELDDYVKQFSNFEHHNKSDSLYQSSINNCSFAIMQQNIEQEQSKDRINKITKLPTLQSLGKKDKLSNQISLKSIDDPPSPAQQIHILDEFKQTYYCIDIDKLINYTFYLPNWNLDKVLTNYEKTKKKCTLSLQRKLNYLGQYTFYYQVKINSLKLRQGMQKNIINEYL